MKKLLLLIFLLPALAFAQVKPKTDTNAIKRANEMYVQYLRQVQADLNAYNSYLLDSVPPRTYLILTPVQVTQQFWNWLTRKEYAQKP